MNGPHPNAQQKDIETVAAILAAGYVRMLAARYAARDGNNSLDSLDQTSDELAMTTSRRSHRG